MLSKACIVGAYQRKLEEMAAGNPDMELTVAVPPSWKDERGIMPLEKAHTQGYQLEMLPLAFNGSYHLHFYPTLRRLLHKIKPDIVHIDEEPYNLATYHANRMARRLGAKTVWFSWQNLVRHYPPPFTWMERYNLRHVDYALMGSQTARKVWLKKGYRGPLAVIPQFGVDPISFTPSPTPRPSETVRLAYVGRLVPEKGVDLLLNALVNLKGNWTLNIQGSGPEELRLHALAQQLNISNRVVFGKPRPSTEMPDFYQNIDVLILPSRSRANWTEQFGRVLIEAMACGVVTVGAESGEIPYVIGDGGLTFAEDDSNALHKLLSRLVEDPALRQTWGQKGRDRVLQHFTQRQIAQDTLKIYTELLS